MAAASSSTPADDDNGTFDCPICFDTVSDAEARPLCAAGHRFCVECSWRCCKSALDDGLVPACPHDKEHKCGTLAKDAAERALSCFLRAGSTQALKAELAAFGIKGSDRAGYRSAKLDEVFLAQERAKQGAVQCIGKNCKEWYVPPVPHSSQPQRLVCTKAKCGTSFCAACRQPYHFRSSCAEALRIHARWVKFLQHELSDFLTAAVKVEPDVYAPVLKLLSKTKNALDEATRDALGRFDELRKMELWKEKHCRHCPGCKRVVEKMSGCDAMRCGSDAHGGNEQRGCGKTFSWARARPYQADLRSAADDGDGSFDGREKRLQLDAREAHELVRGAPVLCDACGEALVGPRLQCVQCAGEVNLCVGCVVRELGKKPLLLRDGTKHPKGHVFRRQRQKPLGDAAIAVGGGVAVVNLTGAVNLTCSDSHDLTGGEASSSGTSVINLTGPPASSASSSGGGEKSRRKRPVSGASAGERREQWPRSEPGSVDLTAGEVVGGAVAHMDLTGGGGQPHAPRWPALRGETIDLLDEGTDDDEEQEEEERQLQAATRASLGEARAQLVTTIVIG